ncbi:MAG: Undecaprenyl-phosphate galactose phosphotransferase [Candidatus Levybacteria bacterium GW2011_GWA2_37_36]|nr:MAG: Undecaprenyl-phosphate galactose phosphotransferase [Candidatus Levybacteria bacterium GW2011_GWA1_37_16]KKQ34064.1 MAG: Undecaprenyl-phosphate galactose phosphotransferase [Candidatus Levybacteria bacterium GW2011_GWA2_37_36]KKQ38256.1 MAG: Undecaprenyl-phosphate galactose phosphotransferase [Candidatus Levybacteria bacterium GW2011_GWC2_37_7]KKQ42331.1 MAG: Undecaprenyl-phosphate galactose phosphotransferase [Candidatus Levybacteria bacterium GW2011_GWB1_37_8]OGH51073.1 MAG: hypotheti
MFNVRVNGIKKSNFYLFAKRGMDVISSIFLLLFFSPIIIVISTAIKLDSKGPILADTPKRVGKNGKLFKMYKFRSMVENAHEILRENPKYSNLYDVYKRGSYKLKDDPRITRVGHFIRKHSLDEIPQALNILKGEMSLVGPRAYYPDELRDQQKKYPHTIDSVKIVLSVKPGVTGFWQVSGRSEINFDKRIEMDATYVKKRSLLYDLWIIIKTPWAMISGRGAL